MQYIKSFDAITYTELMDVNGGCAPAPGQPYVDPMESQYEIVRYCIPVDRIIWIGSN
jgi:hypothetical protein